MTFRADGVFLAPTPECNAGDCTWGAREDEGVRIWWGDAGMHVMRPDEPRAERGRVLSGVRSTDKDPCRATFVRESQAGTVGAHGLRGVQPSGARALQAQDPWARCSIFERRADPLLNFARDAVVTRGPRPMCDDVL